MKYERIYKEYLNREMDKILENLKEVFIEFYGDSNKDKIENVFKDLIIIYMIDNKSKKVLNRKIKESETIYNSIKGIALSHNPKIKEKDLIKLALNNEALIDFRKVILSLSFNKLILSKKRNDDALNIMLGLNRDIHIPKSYKNMITKCVDNSTLGVSINYPIIAKTIGIRVTDDGEVSLHALIHEINHQLQKEVLSRITDRKFEKLLVVSGITNKNNDLINEFFNEYCSFDIMKLFLRKYNSELLDTCITDGYIHIDKISGNVMKKTYNLLKDEIKTRLINGNAQTIRYLIDGDDKYNYILLNTFYLKLMDNRKKAIDKNGRFIISRKKKKELYKFTNNKYKTIQNNYNKYKLYTSNLDKKVNYMVSIGKAKKLSLPNKKV